MSPRAPSESDVARGLADPLRLGILHRLMEGPSPVAELVAALQQSQPNVSNHLAGLRDCGLVERDRNGRQVVYRLSSPSVALLLESLRAVAGPAQRASSRPTGELVRARTCYDHLAGKLGVQVFDALVGKRALVVQDASLGDLGVGARGAEVFGRLGVDVAAAAGARRRFAFACQDWTERKAHLGGSLGALVCEALLSKGWVVRKPRGRALRITAQGARALGRELGVRA